MSTVRRILRFNVKVVDERITLPAGPVVHVAPDRVFMGPGNLEVWIQTTTDQDFPYTGTQGEQDLVVIGTGEPIPAGAEHLASVINSPLVWHLYRVDTASDDLDAVEIPTAEDLEHAIEVLATDLWEADPDKKTPARTFGEDYSNSQDRYRVMARAILAPEPVEPEAKR